MRASSGLQGGSSAASFLAGQADSAKPTFSGEGDSVPFADLLKKHEAEIPAPVAAVVPANPTATGPVASTPAALTIPAPTVPTAPTVPVSPTAPTALTVPIPPSPAGISSFTPVTDPRSPAPAPLAQAPIPVPAPAPALPPAAPQSPAPTTGAASLPEAKPVGYSGASTLLIHAALAGARGDPATPTVDVAQARTGGTAATVTYPSLSAFKAAGDSGGLVLRASGKADPSLATEKKSSSHPANGIFLQGDSLNKTGEPSALPTGIFFFGGSQASSSQTITPSESTGTHSSSSSVDGATGLSGMANGEGKDKMNATLGMDYTAAALESFSGQPSADIHIVLGTNQDFHEALQQVMHVAEHSGLSPLTPPLRVEIEIQTPPGAVVSVYISKQHDQYRAQLSANNAQALSWVQDQIGSLRNSTGDNVVVRWLPPQLETGSLSQEQSTSFNWSEQGRQGGGYQQAGDRQQSSRQKKSAWSGNVSPVLSKSFASAFAPVGGVS